MKKTIYGVILAVFFGFYIFFGNEFGGVNAKALTVDDIQTVDDLRGTKWELNEILNFNAEDFSDNSNLGLRASTVNTYAVYTYGDNVLSLSNRSANSQFISCSLSSNGYVTMYFKNAEGSIISALVGVYDKTSNSEGWSGSFGTLPRELSFNVWETGEVTQVGNFISWLKSNATLQQPEEYKVTILWPILNEEMILTQGESVTINFDELMQTYKNYEYVDMTWSYNENDIGNITLPLYWKLTGFDLSTTPDFENKLFINSGTYTFTENIYLYAVSEEPRNWIFTKFSYIDDSLEGSVEDGYNLLIPFSDNEVNINWTYDDDMIVDITGLEGFKIAISRFDETSIDIIEYSYTSPHSIQFYINKLGYYFNKVEANAYRYWYNTNTSPWEPPYLNDYYKFNPQEDIEYYDLTNRSTNISVYDDEPTAILYITQEVNYNYEGGGNEGDQLNGAMITFFSLITGLINLKFGFISIGGILAILFGVALLTFIFKIWNGNNNG